MDSFINVIDDLVNTHSPSTDASGSDSGNKFLGIALIVVGGILAGLYTTWMSRARGQWENIWLQYSLWGMVIFPWIFAAATNEHLVDTISHAKASAIIAAVGFGFAWGWGSVCFGTAVSMVGDSMTFTVVLGLTAALGSVLPLVIQHTSDVKTDKGAYTFGGLGAVLIGIGLTSMAGRQRERDLNEYTIVADDEENQVNGAEGMGPSNDTSENKVPPRRFTGGARSAQSGKSDTHSTLSGAFTGQGKKPVEESAERGSFALGMAVCILSGVLSPCLNFAISFSDDLNDQAEDLGISTAAAGNVPLALAVTGGFVANATACLIKLYRNKTWPYFFRDEDENSVTGSGFAVTMIVAITMGAMWFFGTALYNIGSNMLGKSEGKVLGWPLFMDGMIITANISGVIRGEWAGTSCAAKLWLVAALFLLLGAVVIIAAGG